MEIKLIHPLCDPEWDRLIVSHRDCTFFHSGAWAKVLCKTYCHKPVYLHCSQGGRLIALIPMMEVCSPLTGRRGICLPFTDFCDPLTFGDVGPGLAVNKLTEVAQERRWKYFEVRGTGKSGFPAEYAKVFYGHMLDLRRGADDLFARFKGSTRRALRKAERSCLTVQVARTREAIQQFYQLHIRTRRRHGLPPQPFSFFLNIYEEVIKADLGFVVMASFGSHPVAAAVFFHFGKKAVYKFNASNERCQEFRGNNLIIWEGIRYLVQNGTTTLHFGRTSLENEGLRRFKLNWGSEEGKIEYLKFDTSARSWVTPRETVSGFHEMVFARLPLALNRLAGAIIYPHLD